MKEINRNKYLKCVAEFVISYEGDVGTKIGVSLTCMFIVMFLLANISVYLIYLSLSVCQIDPSWGGPIELFLVSASAP